MEAPDYLDGAKVIRWAWSGEKPFGYVGNEDDKERVYIYGLAICKYEEKEGSGSVENVYRFSCDKNWETLQDSLYDTIENAILNIPLQYKNVNLDWHTK